MAFICDHCDTEYPNSDYSKPGDGVIWCAECSRDEQELLKGLPLVQCFTMRFDVVNSWSMPENVKVLQAVPKKGRAKVSPQEKPCKQCGRKNFLTDKSCWWCCVPNPTV
jgi:hypothetical protein